MFRKFHASLVNDSYRHPKTNLLVFQFEPSEENLPALDVRCDSVDGKDIYTIDNFFKEEAAQELLRLSKTGSYSRPSYGSPEAIERGEKPARSMNGKERWAFFSSPPRAVQEIYRWLGQLSRALDAEISTLPWELCDGTNSSPSVIANFLETASLESMELGKHRDSDPSQGLSFGIPVLYEPGTLHPSHFQNGETGRPWIVSLMLYAADASFAPSYRMGTAFYREEGKLAFETECRHMRMVLFEADIIHSIAASEIPAGVNTWRVSYVFKLVVNPRRKEQNLKREFLALL